MLSSVLDMMSDEVPASWLPVPGEPELGCGVYGCVYQTADPSVVLKLTSDDTEAEFAQHIRPMMAPDIAVRYHKTIPLSHKSPRGAWLFLLWRESASHVGDVQLLGERAFNLVADQADAGDAAYGVASQMEDHLDLYVESWLMRCREMGEVPSLRWLADGLVTNFQDHGILFGDLRPSNIGRALRGGVEQWVITDPGRVAIIER